MLPNDKIQPIAIAKPIKGVEVSISSGTRSIDKVKDDINKWLGQFFIFAGFLMGNNQN